MLAPYSRASLAIFVTAGLLFAARAAAQPPQQISYQGRFVVSGEPVNGAVSMTFRLYDASTGGSLLWSEVHPSVSVASGLFSVALGSIEPLALPFDVPYFLGVTVGTDPELQPRQPLSSVAYAMRSAVAESASPDSVTGAMIAPAAITLEKLALVCNVGDTIARGETGWECRTLLPPCSPTTEVCNGIDDNCNASVDEGFGVGTLCSVGLGACLNTGGLVCKPDGTGTECSANPGAPSPETCDGIDNDCNGAVDNPWLNNGKYDHNQACGSCGIDCTAIYAKPHAQGICNAAGTPICVMACDAGYYDLNGLPFDGCEFFLDASAVYVSASDASAADNSTCGNGPSEIGGGRYPCQSISHAISRAQNAGRNKALVADGLYAEAVSLVNGISVLGGYRPDNWERHLASTNTIIQGVTSMGDHDLTVIASGITLPTTFEGFLVRGSLNAKPSGNSYAIYVSGSDGNLAIQNNVIYAGRGGPGATGSTGGDGTPGANGVGRDSNPADYDAKVATGGGTCSVTNNRSWSNGGTGTCGGSDVVNGGDGGGNRCPPVSNLTEFSGIDGFEGQPGDGGSAGGVADAGDDSRLESGGATCFVPAETAVGQGGTSGQAGAVGAAASGCALPLGSVSGGHWAGGLAQPGVAGANGGGGGGGGAGGGAFCLSCAGSKDRLGGHGGGGGAGGCGGSGGGVGASAGGVFGIFINGAAAPVVTANVIVRGEGGSGGIGGGSGRGGQGGTGGAGGLGIFCTGPAGSGGGGGAGGHGSGGGGGCGGASFGMYAVGGATAYCAPEAGNVVSGGTGGPAGAGGQSLVNAGSGGQPGTLVTCSP